MATAHQARVPHILQNDVGALIPMRCGPACAQAILYGFEDRVFDAPTGALVAGLPVREHQEAIWTEIKSMSGTVAAQLGGEAAISEEQQVCAGEPRQCWATHPSALEAVLRAGVQTSGLHLSGNGNIAAQMMSERDVASAVVDSISQGVGAAILIDRAHWVVAYKTSPRGEHDVDIYFHDPLLTTPTVWHGIDELLAAVVDIQLTTDASETAVVGAPGADFEVLRRTLRSQPDAVVAPRFDDLARQDIRAILGDDAGSVAALGVSMGQGEPTRVLPVRHLWNPARSYFIVEFWPTTMVIVDARTYRPRLTAGSADGVEALPTILNPDEIRAVVAGKLVSLDGREVTLGSQRLHIQPELLWGPCDQSRSMFIPFYAVEQEHDGGGAPDRLYVRASDGQPFAHLSRRP